MPVHDPDAIDLREMEKDLLVVEERIQALEEKSIRMPWEAAELKKLNDIRASLFWDISSAQEFVRTNAIQSEIHENLVQKDTPEHESDRQKRLKVKVAKHDLQVKRRKKPKPKR
jgi:hypothetical protein